MTKFGSRVIFIGGILIGGTLVHLAHALPELKQSYINDVVHVTMEPHRLVWEEEIEQLHHEIRCMKRKDKTFPCVVPERKYTQKPI